MVGVPEPLFLVNPLTRRRRNNTSTTINFPVEVEALTLSFPGQLLTPNRCHHPLLISLLRPAKAATTSSTLLPQPTSLLPVALSRAKGQPPLPTSVFITPTSFSIRLILRFIHPAVGVLLDTEVALAGYLIVHVSRCSEIVFVNLTFIVCHFGECLVLV